MFRAISTYACLVLAICVTGCGNARPRRDEKSFLVMGTFASVTARGDDGERLDEFVATVQEVMGELDSSLSKFKQDSEVSRVSDMAGRSAVPVSERTYRILAESQKYAKLTGGAFDATVTPLLTIWGHGKDGELEVPTPELIQSTMERVGYRHLILSNDAAYLAIEDMQIDLGGIAKGYAVDLCWDELSGQGASNVLINLGGNIRCCGPADEALPWRVGVRNPFDADPTSTIGVLSLTNGMATATSGDYERYVVIDGRRYGHVIDPRTGWPAGHVAGVTIVCTNATQADAISTAFFVLGMEQSKAILSRMPDCDALFVPVGPPTDDSRNVPLEIWITEGMREYFEPSPSMANRVFLLK